MAPSDNWLDRISRLRSVEEREQLHDELSATLDELRDDLEEFKRRIEEDREAACAACGDVDLGREVKAVLRDDNKNTGDEDEGEDKDEESAGEHELDAPDDEDLELLLQ